MAAERNRALLDWYGQHRRDLPWRGTSDPWAILVSEVMSQQTQIARVAPAWEQFMDRFPTPADLAGAETSELIEMWGGLGYQRRAINLQRAAQAIAETGWPSDCAGLQRLPGVGPYTAAAVACFAFGLAVPAVDTNLKRILSRWAGVSLSGSELSATAAAELPLSDASDWNQALMDLGAMVCRPRSPRCGVCPVETWCADPDVYEPPPRQSQYQGSVREARAAILKTLARGGPSSMTERVAATGLEAETVGEAAVALVRESTVARSEGLLSLAG